MSFLMWPSVFIWAWGWREEDNVLGFGGCADLFFFNAYVNYSLLLVINQPSRLTAKPEEVIDASEQLHSHVVVDQRVLQHARLETQVSDMLPHPALTALLIMPEIKVVGGGEQQNWCRHSIYGLFQHDHLLMSPKHFTALMIICYYYCFDLQGAGNKADQSDTKRKWGWEHSSRDRSRLKGTNL